MDCGDSSLKSMRRSDCIDVSLEMLYDHLLVILGMIYIYIYKEGGKEREWFNCFLSLVVMVVMELPL